MTSTMNRRKLVAGTLALTSSVALSPNRPALAQDKTVIQWWEHFPEGMNKAVREQYMSDHSDVEIKLTKYAPNEMNQALQLAYQSGQMPDITTTPGAAGTSIDFLIREGWFAPLPNADAISAALPEGSLLEGLSIFDGKLYSFPIFSPRQYTTLLWYNTDILEQAEVDPATALATWDGFRDAARKITEAGNGRIYGWLQGINFADRIATHVTELAEMAGAPGTMDYRTGEYVHASDPFLQAMEFLLSVNSDGSLFPASTTLDARNGRARWAAGSAGMFFDGPWNAGVVNQDFPELLDTLGVAPVPTPNGETDTYIHSGPPGGTYFLPAMSQNVETSADILTHVTGEDYYIQLASRMDQPPLDLGAVDKADVHPTYKQAMTFFADRVRFAPSPVARNAAVSKVTAEMKPIDPDFGQIIIGAFTGQVPDVKAAFTQYADALTAERERAIKVVNDAGTPVSIDDWVFADWDPTQDYGGQTATPVASPES